MAEIDVASFAFYGSGEVDLENATTLLDEYLPQSIGAALRPARIPRNNKPLSSLVDWLESPDILGENGTIPAADLVAELVKRRDVEHHSRVELLVLWPAEPTEQDKALVTEARAAGIKVVSIGDALDDLLWEPEVEEVAEPEDEAVEEVAETVASAEDVESLVNAMGKFFGQALEPVLRAIARDELRRHLATTTASTAAPVADKASVEAVAAKLSGEKPKADAGPPFDPPFKSAGDAEPARTAYWMSEDGNYRKKTGRRRKGETEALLTLSEESSLAASGKITDD